MKYTQNNENLIINTYFKDELGAFLDLGAFTGVELSNVRELAERGWRGVMVEASPSVFEKLVYNYKDFHNVDCFNVAVGTETKKMIFFDNHSAVGSLHENETKRWGDTQSFTEIEIQCVEINEFLKLWNRQQLFDLVSIDIEGNDYDVAKRIDFRSLCARMVIIEWNSIDLPKYDAIFIPQGYHLIHSNAENLIYVI